MIIAGERGLSLIEMIVAWALTLTVLLGTLGLTSALRRSYLKTEMTADATERLRIAMESMAHDLRLAGLGVDPDGAVGRPDEPLEGAWAGAIASRADLDADDPLSRDDPERWIAGAFPSTRTGNDEIVVYALRRESGSGGEELVFEADVAAPSPVTTPSGDRVAPRDGIVEAIRLPRIVGASGGSAGPGCILYRATVSSNAGVWGTGNAVVWQPLADGIATLSFSYFDESGGEIAAPGGAEAARALRAAIAGIEVRVVALEKRADPLWRDPQDTNPATWSYRKGSDAIWVGLRNRAGTTRRESSGPPPFPPS